MALASRMIAVHCFNPLVPSAGPALTKYLRVFRFYLRVSESPRTHDEKRTRT